MWPRSLETNKLPLNDYIEMTASSVTIQCTQCPASGNMLSVSFNSEDQFHKHMPYKYKISHETKVVSPMQPASGFGGTTDSLEFMPASPTRHVSLRQVSVLYGAAGRCGDGLLRFLDYCAGGGGDNG